MENDWLYQVKCWDADGSVRDYYKNAEGRWCGLPCYSDPDEAIRHLSQLGIRGGVLRRRECSPNATGGWYWLTHGDVTNPSKPSDPDDNICRWVGPGRGDCWTEIGLEVGVDGYGRPLGWCWGCWLKKRNSVLTAVLKTIESALADHVVNKIEASGSDWALRLSEVRQALGGL